MRKPVTISISILLVVLAVVMAKILVKTAPQAERKRPPKMAALVETRALKATDETIVLKLTGTVTPAEEVKLQARVTGEVVAMAPNFIDGGILKKGEAILEIDPVDFELAIADAEAKLEKARFDYKEELGRQEVAKHEWNLLKTGDATDLEKELALRKPHLAADEAALKAAEAALKKAQINLERTGIRAPFNAIVTERSVHIGSQATQQAELGMLVGIDAYWVMVSIPVDRLKWITIPGSSVQIISNSGAEREGKVIKLLGDLEEKGRMARLLVEVRDPLCVQPENADKKPLLLGEYVGAEISGLQLKNIYSIPRDALREGSIVWLAKKDMLDIRKVDVIWRDEDQVFIQNALNDGEQLIVSDLTAPIQGMALSAGENTPEKPAAPNMQLANEE